MSNPLQKRETILKRSTGKLTEQTKKDMKRNTSVSSKSDADVTQAKNTTKVESSPIFSTDIGRRIRNLRRIKGLTLKDLADRAPCSESMLSKVENGKAQLSLTLLHRIVHSLDITITALFSESRADQGVVTRAKDRSTFHVDGNGSRLERLVPPNLGHLLEGNLHIIAPGGGSNGVLTHEGEEVGYVLSGTFELTVSGIQYLLHSGDSFVYRSEEPHSYRNPGKIITRVLWVSTPPTF